LSEIRVVISSGHNRPDASGLYLFDGSTVRMIDAYPCAGLSANGGRFYRISALRQGDGAELLVYDAQGICRYHRIDGVSDPHDILALQDGRVLCVSSFQNTILSLAADGTTTTYWQADGPLDSWHLNCLALHDARLYATAFGRFDSFRGWHPSLGAGAGILFDVESGETIVTGLSQPHTPRWIDGAWVICNSGEQSVVRVEPNGSRLTVPVGGFTRGMCSIGDRVYVGVSSPRRREAVTTGWISVLDRKRWVEVDRIPTPCGGMFDLLEVDETTVRSLEAGFRVGCERERYFGQLAMFEQVGVTPMRVWAVGDVLVPELCRIKIAADLPAALVVGDAVRVNCTVENTGDGFLVSAAPHPVEVCYRWFDDNGSAVGAGTWEHTRLPRTLVPRGSATFKVIIAAPPIAGRFTLRLTLLQENVCWFDDIDPANAVSAEVVVGERTTAARPRNRGAATR
jgi:acetolactate synthase-1/2/3 large subunit